MNELQPPATERDAMVTNVIEVRDRTSLDTLIERLVAVRESLPNGTEAEMRLRNCDITGPKLAITCRRPAAGGEASVDWRLMDAYRESREREMLRLQREVGSSAANR